MTNRLLIPFFACIIWLVGRPTEADDTIEFDRDIKPLLSDRCFKCHGPDSASNESGLRLDNAEGLKSVIQPGSPENSDLFERIIEEDSDFLMPPPDSKLSLSKAEINTIRTWIKQGAKWDTHWAFKRVSRSFPDLEKSENNQSPIDVFVNLKLEQIGLEQNERADRYSLARRVSFDLTGLPPTVEEVNSFVNDQSPDAYEKLVDRLLASERFGERMASMWLDVARYSDTYGYQVDRDRFVWPWRDWVIEAFNNNMPYDQFLLEQIAGDMLPNASDKQVLATAFNRLHPQKVEGGSVPEEFRTEYVADRAQTVATAFMGLTFECARCHDHKYDPISQQEYYQLFAFFNNIDEAGLYSFFTNSVPTPTLSLLDEKQRQELTDARQKLDHQIEVMQTLPMPELDQTKAWLARYLEDIKTNPNKTARNAVEHQTFDDTLTGDNQTVPGKIKLGLQLSGDDEYKLKSGNFTRWQPFSFSLWINNPKSRDRAVVFHRSRAWTDAGSRGYQLLIEDDRLSFSLIHFWPGNAIRVVTKQKLPLNQWTHVAISYDGTVAAAGVKIFVDGEMVETEVVRDCLTKKITGGGGDEIAIGARFRDRGFGGGIVDDFRVYDRKLTELEAYCLSQQTTPAQLLSTNEIDKQTLGDPILVQFLRSIYDKELAQSIDAVTNASKELCRAQDATQEIMVMREMKQTRPTHVLQRGVYDAPGKVVEAGTPGALPPMMDAQPKNRLGLAKWLTHPDHPLTARVAVNRLWQICFGTGLVATPEDFGNQGSPPSHPQLLDWLASDFVDNQWDVKRTLKMIVMSDTYCQSSALTKPKLQKDPQNRWLCRAPRTRLTAEMIRDNVLSASGLLVEKLGGPPARPYEVTVSFKPVNRDKGTGLYRRSLYTYWKRTGPAPVMMTLDASKRDVCRVKREHTNTSLQSLVLLNDPQINEAARVLASRLMDDNPSVDKAIETMFFRLTSRPPTEQETQTLLQLFNDQQKHFVDNPDLAKQFLAIGDTKLEQSHQPAEMAALSIVCVTIMNHHDCIYRR